MNMKYLSNSLPPPPKKEPLNNQRCTLLTSYKTYSHIHLIFFQSQSFDPILMAKPKPSNST